MRKEPSLVIKQLISERYNQAAAVFWAGSCARNQGNQASDLDLVIEVPFPNPRFF